MHPWRLPLTLQNRCREVETGNLLPRSGHKTLRKRFRILRNDPKTMTRNMATDHLCRNQQSCVSVNFRERSFSVALQLGVTDRDHLNNIAARLYRLPIAEHAPRYHDAFSHAEYVLSPQGTLARMMRSKRSKFY